MGARPGPREVKARRVRFQWPADQRPVWTPARPEMAIAANAVSLMMPHVEPYIVATVREAMRAGPVAEALAADDELAAATRGYVHQEAQHHAQHRRFNDRIVTHYPRLHKVERLMAWFYARLRRRSTRFGLAYASGAETIAFVAARWVDRRLSLLRGADATPATLFLWHLAEEVEHKDVAFDLYQASGGGRLMHAWGTIVAALAMFAGVVLGTLPMLWAERRMFSPRAHARLFTWSLSFVFVALPVMVVAVLPGHHPRDLVDPAGLDHWLDHLDPETSTVPEWALP